MSGVIDDTTPRFTIRDAGVIISLVVAGAFAWTRIEAEITALEYAQQAQADRIAAAEVQQRANATTLGKICEAVQCNKQGIDQ
jgi:hypothetical protein